MEPTVTPEPQRKRGKQSRAVLLAAAMVAMTAIPAGAGILIQNFIKGDISANPACMVKLAGADASNASGIVAFNTTATLTTPEGVNLLNETFTIKGMKGDRLITTDGGTIKNNCTYPLTVSLTAEAQGASPAIAGDWTDLSATVYLGASGGAATPDFTNATNWAGSPIKAKVGTAPAGTVTNATTATVTLAAGASARMAWVVDAGTGALATTAAPATLRYTVTGTP